MLLYSYEKRKKDKNKIILNSQVEGKGWSNEQEKGQKAESHIALTREHITSKDR